MLKPKYKRLIVLALSLTSIAAGVAIILNNLSSNVMFFQTPTEVRQNKITYKVIRLGGIVKPGTVKKIENSIITEFILTDCANEIVVHHKGLLPNLFREGQGMVAKGSIDGANIFISDELLAKHDEYYMPAELRDKIALDPICNPKSIKK